METETTNSMYEYTITKEITTSLSVYKRKITMIWVRVKEMWKTQEFWKLDNWMMIGNINQIQIWKIVRYVFSIVSKLKQVWWLFCECFVT